MIAIVHLAFGPGVCNMRHRLTPVFLFSALLCLNEAPAKAAEDGIGAYLLGSRSNGAGITPPPGVYFNDDTYFYDAKIGGGKSLPFGGLLVANISVQTWMNLPTTLWVTPAKITRRRPRVLADVVGR